VYFCFSDLVLILQCLYYNVINARKEARKLSAVSARSEDEPLLNRRNSDNLGLPGSHRRKSSAASRRHRESVNRRDSLANIVEEESGGREWLKNAVSIVGVCIVGAAGWAIAWRAGAWKPTPVDDGQSEPIAMGAQILGYASAVAYLGYVSKMPVLVSQEF